MHLACSTISSGIPLSGAFMTSCKTSPAFCRRSSTFVLAALAHKGPAKESIATSSISFFIMAPKLTHRGGGGPPNGLASLGLNRDLVCIDLGVADQRILDPLFQF